MLVNDEFKNVYKNWATLGRAKNSTALATAFADKVYSENTLEKFRDVIIRDKVVGKDAQKEIAEKLGCDIYMYGNEYGHAVYDEAPDYIDRIMDFYRSISGDICKEN